MDHVAIMKKSWQLLPKILSGEKTIESRWYKTKRIPWNRINTGDTVYFKNSGEPVTVQTAVQKVLQFENLNGDKVSDILDKYGGADGITPERIPDYYDLFKAKKYCLLIFLKNPQSIKPFNINKKGFGAMSAWLTVDNIDKIKV